jgi:hypothetical protein
MFMVIKLYELWARRRNGSCDLIVRFERYEEIFYRMDCLDPEEFSEGLVLKDGHCVLYKIFDLKKGRKR